jgi:hypothetical protein
MATCTVCGVGVTGSYHKDGDQAFCSLKCLTENGSQGFCDRCLSSTTDDSPGNTYAFNLIGTNLISPKERCPFCHSVEMKKVIQWVIPLKTLGRYRVLFSSPVLFVGRKVRDF